jgi:hypothetical protein
MHRKQTWSTDNLKPTHFVSIVLLSLIVAVNTSILLRSRISCSGSHLSSAATCSAMLFDLSDNEKIIELCLTSLDDEAACKSRS